jgi:hypothetical protein
MLNRKLCAACVGKYEKQLAEKDKQIEELKSLNNDLEAEIRALLEGAESNKSTFTMMVLKHDPKYNRWKDISAKVREESLELQDELYHTNYDGIVEEALDLITVAMNAINKCAELGIDIEFAVSKHQKKLLERGWEAEKVISFSIKEATI